MQVNVTVECSPQEARSFLGLPDLTSLHEIYLERLRSFASEGIKPEDLERLYTMWGSGMTEGFEQWRRLLMQTGSGMMTPPR